MKVAVWGARASFLAMAIGMAVPALAQDRPAADSPNPADQQVTPSEDEGKDIVVTGTLIRGVAPVGTNVVGLSKEQITGTGATSTNDVLARVPQITNYFNKVNIATSTDFGITSSLPNIRNLTPNGSSTLVLVDGHRLVGAGALSSLPDPDTVPPAVIERVEVVPDGGSSTYGSDAVGGVINLITRRRFDGVLASARYGFADNYYQYDLNATAGKDWGSGSLYLTYVFTKHDAILGIDRDYIRQITPTTNCSPGTIRVGATTYALPDRVAGTKNTCDASDYTSLVPAEKRHSVFAGLSQDLNSAISVDLRAYYTYRQAKPSLSSFRQSVAITSVNPFFRPIGTETSQAVDLNYSSVFGPSYNTSTTMNQWGTSANLKAKLGSGWQLTVLGSYGRNNTVSRVPLLNTSLQSSALAATTTATALNPYDLTQTNPTVLAGLRNYEQYAMSKQDLYDGRAILDGPLFRLPGGDVRAAVGAEIIYNTYDVEAAAQRVPGSRTGVNAANVGRTVKSVFGEINVPVFGSGNGFGGMESLTLSASGRYDHYDDFGGTFNPKFGATWKPVSWVAIRGNYGTSFNAPQLGDTTGAVDGRATVLPIAALDPATQTLLTNPAVPRPAFPLPTVIIVAGGNPNLKPQTAKTFSVGADVKPPFIPGLSLSGTYYNVNFKNLISLAAGTNLFRPEFAPFVITNPSQATVASILGNLPVVGTANSVASIFAPTFPIGGPYLLWDLRRNNLGTVRTDGIDFNASYVRPTGFGSVNLNVSGNYVLSRKTRVFATSPEVDSLATDNPKLYLSAGLGAKVGDFTAQATLYHTAGYTLGVPAGTQTQVSSFNTVDLYFAYDIKSSGLLRDLSLTLSVNNAFDQDPPFLNSGNGYTNGSTLGRLIQFGISKKF